MRIKICGIRNIEDAKKAIYFGADAIGLLVGQKGTSDDFISIEMAKKIVKHNPPYVSSALVTHLETPKEIIQLISEIGVDTIQIHSNCNVQNVTKIRNFFSYLKIIKNFHVNQYNLNDLITDMQTFEKIVDAYILDTINLAENKVGGTGITHDWSISSEVVKRINRPIILAGGLKPDNVTRAIEIVRPFGVDVNSGVKDCRGFKDSKKLLTFIHNAKAEFFKIRCTT